MATEQATSRPPHEPVATGAGAGSLPFLAPRAIAIIGASAKPEKRGYQAIARLLADGFDPRRIFPINPRETQILGIAVYPSVLAVPEPIDLALVCTPARSLPAVLEDCGRKGIGGAVVLAAGFAEAGAEGQQLERAMLEAARQGGVRLIGPNTNGIFNLHRRLNLVGVSDAEPGEIGILSQSGNMMLALVAEAKSRGGIGFSTYVGVGNQADIGFDEYIDYFAQDAATRVPVLYVEGFKNGRRFLERARDLIRSKPLVVYKSGRTAEGQRSAGSHTGSLAGSYRLTHALLRQCGVTLVSETDKILPIAEALAKLPLPGGDRVAVLCDSGGHGTITTDALIGSGLRLAVFSEATDRALRQLLPPSAALANPVDVAGATDEDTSVFAACAGVLLADPNVDVVLIVGMLGAYSVRFSPSLRDNELRTSRRLLDLVRAHGKPVLAQSVYEPLKPEPLQLLREGGIPVHMWAETAVEAIRALVDYAAVRRRSERTTAAMRLDPRPEAAAIIARARGEGRQALMEPEARDLLRSYGVPLPDHVVARAAEDLERLPPAMNGQPLAMKVVSPDILHKSDAGGVRLNVTGGAARREAFTGILGRCRSHAPQARLDGVLVTPMLEPGVEVIVGMSRDPVFGPVMMFGLGGIFVEVLKDVTFRAIPLAMDDARSMIDEIGNVSILNGARGGQGVDRDSLAELLVRLSAVVEAHPEIAELDLNPVIARPGGCAVADARILLVPGSAA